MKESLPHSIDLNIAALSQLLTKTTNSYKYIFFLSILDIAERKTFKIHEPITFKELVAEMLMKAWYPHAYFKLSFGRQDQIVQNLKSLPLESIVNKGKINATRLSELIHEQDLEQNVRSLLRYVPFRLLTPFFEQEKTSIYKHNSGNNLDKAIPRLAEEYFEQKKPLYKFNSIIYSECTSIILHPEWISYLQQHFSIIRDWASWRWLQYMQRKNPSTPGLINKLRIPQKRASLKRQTTYWKVILTNTNLRCIYTNKELSLDRLSLDHYLPWSFVVHDQLWNLIPTFPEVNSSKSDSLPPNVLLDKFVEIQHHGLTVYHKTMSSKDWKYQTESYIEDLGLTSTELLDSSKLHTAYKAVIPPLVTLASNQGFKFWLRGAKNSE